MRRRLALTFVLVAGVSTGLLAAGSYVLVSGQRNGDALERGMEQASFKLGIASRLLSSPPTANEVGELISLYRLRGTFEVIILLDGREYMSHAGLTSRDVPPQLREDVEMEDGLAYQRITEDGAPYLLIGGVAPGTDAELFFFQSQRRLVRGLMRLGAVLLGGWLAIMGLAVLVGRSLARRTLRPVRQASEAAGDVAAGLLGTRLAIERHDEFGLWAASFNRMAEALEVKVAELEAAREHERRFSADVSHELRTPLSAIAAEVSLLERHMSDLPEAVRRPLDLLVRDVARLRVLIEGLSEIALGHAGRSSLRPESLDLSAVVRRVVASRGWDGAVHLEGGPLHITTDVRRLELVLANLVGNAVEHGGGEAWVRLHSRGEEVAVEVTDRGGGIAARHLPKVFERFYKADPARGGGGSGLGLAIAKENAALLGGRLEVRSEEGEGSTFLLTIPRSLAPHPRNPSVT